MTEPLSLMEFVSMLARSDEVQAHFAADPGGVLSAFGLGDLGPADVDDAKAFVEDNRTVDWSHDYGTGEHPSHDLSFDAPTGDAGADAQLHADALHSVDDVLFDDGPHHDAPSDLHWG
jgi:hypothetical protein